MVLTHEDYLEFLITLAKDRGMGSNRVVPKQVLPAMTRKPLLFLGYGLRDWSFRTLFRGLYSTMSEVQRRRHISIQLTPPVSGRDKAARQRAEKYLRDYYDQLRISVHWGTVDRFCTELARRLATQRRQPLPPSPVLALVFRRTRTTTPPSPRSGLDGTPSGV